jgi:hypothetical protein
MPKHAEGPSFAAPRSLIGRPLAHACLSQPSTFVPHFTGDPDFDGIDFTSMVTLADGSSPLAVEFFLLLSHHALSRRL